MSDPEVTAKNYVLKKIHDLSSLSQFLIIISISVYIGTWILAIVLIYIEFWYFMNPDHTFKFVPDKEFSGFVDINVDMTVAMPCESKKHIWIYENDNTILLYQNV